MMVNNEGKVGERRVHGGGGVLPRWLSTMEQGWMRGLLPLPWERAAMEQGWVGGDGYSVMAEGQATNERGCYVRVLKMK
ncbi:hypothetical protein Dimus_018270, partial [Dionaea muscipula]